MERKTPPPEFKTTLQNITGLNETDWIIIIKLMDKYASKKIISVGELTKEVGIAPVNMWKHLNKLQELDLILVPEVKRGKKKFISFNPDLKMDKKNKEIFLKFATGVLKEICTHPEKQNESKKVQ